MHNKKFYKLWNINLLIERCVAFFFEGEESVFIDM